MNSITSFHPSLMYGSVSSGSTVSEHANKLHRLIISYAGAISAFFILATALAHCLLREGTASLPGFALFDVDSEANVPTWYASMLLQACAIIAFVISFHDDKAQKTGWRGIAVILLLMDMDEIAGLHNIPSRRLSAITGLGDGYLMNAWVIPAVVILAILGLIYLPFVWRLPRWLKWSLLIASTAYLLGAVGFEVLGSHFEYKAGGLHFDPAVHYSFRFAMTGVAEEAYEHIGVLATLSIFLKHAFNLSSKLVMDFVEMKITAGNQ